MKKRVVLALALIISGLLGAASNAQAGGYGHRGAGYGSGHHYSRGYGGYHGGGHHHGGGNDFVEGLAIVTGAAILGAVIYDIHQSQPRSSQPAGPVPVSAGVWYRMDGNGRCVEVRLNQQGREIWTDVDSSYCR